MLGLFVGFFQRLQFHLTAEKRFTLPVRHQLDPEPYHLTFGTIDTFLATQSHKSRLIWLEAFHGLTCL